MSDHLQLILTWLPWAVLAGISGAVIYWGLFGDRARGRRRCPKCWYNMIGSPGMMCPECGFAARRERQFHRDRRRWRAVTLGLFMLTPLMWNALHEAHGERWWRAWIPESWLVTALPWADDGSHFVARELGYRAMRDELSDATWDALFERCLTGDGDAAPPSPAWELKYGRILVTHAPRFMADEARAMRRLELPPRFDLVRVSPAASDEPLCVEIMLRHWWPRGFVTRVTFEAFADGVPLLESPVVARHVDLPGSSRPFPLVMPPPPSGARSIDLRVTAERIDVDGSVRRFEPVTLTAPVQHAGGASTMLNATTDPEIERLLREALGGRVGRHASDGADQPGARRVSSLRFTRAFRAPVLEGVAIGLRIEILRDDEVVHVLDHWGEGGAGPGQFRRQWLHSPDGLSFVDAMGADGAAWTMRVRGERGLALRVPGATTWWQGEFTMPLIVEDTGRPAQIEEWTIER